MLSIFGLPGPKKITSVLWKLGCGNNLCLQYVDLIPLQKVLGAAPLANEKTSPLLRKKEGKISIAVLQ